MLENINSPKDIKTLNYGDLKILSEEIRNEICTVVSENGGHLASNLGIVDLTIALHRVFDFSKDSLIFDVGHQCYAHKLITGRREGFSSIRKMGGLSGFTNRSESSYDTLTAGHSGPSVSAGLGIAKANAIAGNDNYVVSVVGDGSFTNGMIYEALNNCDKKSRFIIILNDNEMSISSNVGNLSKHFSRLRTSKKYFVLKHRIKKIFSSIPFIGNGLVKFTGGAKDLFKRMVIKNDDFFTALGVKYLGPVDGHDVRKLEIVLEEAKNLNECCMVIVKTRKGKGYAKAEETPESYHSVGKFSIADGVEKSDKTNFSDLFGKIMLEKAEQDDKIVAITAAMCEGTGLLEFSKQFPDRFFDVGIAEEHEVGFASGLSAGGMKPVCAVYSTFSQRVYDQVFHDLSVQGLSCVLALDRAGFVPDDGITHQGLFDVSLFSSIPGCNIYSPETYDEMKTCFDKVLDAPSLSVVRYPKGSMTEYDRSGFESFCGGDVCISGEMDAEVVIVTYGRICKQAYDAAKALEGKCRVKIIKLVKVYPFDFDFIYSHVKNAKLVYFLEEGVSSGGVSEKISSLLCGKYSGKIIIRAVGNTHTFHASVEQLMSHFGMTAEHIEKEIVDNLA